MTARPSLIPAAILVAAGLVASVVSAATRPPEPPVAASPGGTAGFPLHSGRCPTFLWGAVSDAESYELVVYRLSDDAAAVEAGLTPVLHHELPGSIHGWTPPLGRCPEPGRRYAWTVRAAVAGGETEWSEARLFRIEAAPSVAEVEDALAVLRRFLAAEQRLASKASLAAPTRDFEGDSGLAPKATPVPLTGRALTAPTVGATPPPMTVTPPGSYALSIDGDFELAGHVFKGGHPFLHTDGGYEAHNLGLGWDALVSATPSDPPALGGRYNTALGSQALRLNGIGSQNTATGAYALAANTVGLANTALGVAALLSNTEGSYNTAIGGAGLLDNLDGDHNTAVGVSALTRNLVGDDNTAVGGSALSDNTIGTRNTALGRSALRRSSFGERNTGVGAEALENLDDGDDNIALGFGAGFNLDDGDGNIYIGNRGEEIESDTIRIGADHTAMFVAGVRDTNVGSGIQVLVGGLGRLGTTTSSRRFKEEIADMGDASSALLALRPVTFRYTEDAIGEGPRPVDFGLIAEEVAEIYPDLVAYDEQGRPYSVRYHVLPAMLLNEIQRQHERDLAQRREIERLENRLRALESARGSPAEE